MKIPVQIKLVPFVSMCLLLTLSTVSQTFAVEKKVVFLSEDGVKLHATLHLPDSATIEAVTGCHRIESVPLNHNVEVRTC